MFSSVISFKKARDICNVLGGYLPTFDSPKERDESYASVKKMFNEVLIILKWSLNYLNL